MNCLSLGRIKLDFPSSSFQCERILIGQFPNGVIIPVSLVNDWKLVSLKA